MANKGKPKFPTFFKNNKIHKNHNPTVPTRPDPFRTVPFKTFFKKNRRCDFFEKM